MQVKLKITGKGDLKNTQKYLEGQKIDGEKVVKLGQYAVKELSKASPVRTGELRDSWDYNIERNEGKEFLNITNHSHQDVSEGIVHLLENGHYVHGGYVKGSHFVKNTMDEVYKKFDVDIEEDIKNGK